jgi:hypothetical protein
LGGSKAATKWSDITKDAVSPERVKEIGLEMASGLENLVKRLPDPRTIRAESLKPKESATWMREQVGHCLMIGGEPEDFTRVESVFKTLAPPNGYL